MILKYDIEIDNAAIVKDIGRLTNQIFKLLPSREEGSDWIPPLENLIREIGGMANLIGDQMDFFCLLCKLESLLSLTGEDDFLIFRKTIFECLSLLGELKKCLASTE